MINRKNKKEVNFLIIIFLIVFFFRIYFSTQTLEFSDDNAYFNLRNIENIIKTGKPLAYDELSYSGKQTIAPPLFYYIMAFSSIILPFQLAMKIIPALFISFLVIIIYIIAKEISNNNEVSILAALISGFIPILISDTINQISILSLVLPMFFFMIYCIMKMREERTYLVYFVILSLLLPLTSSLAFLLILTLIIYSLLMIAESWNLRRTNKEAISFAILSTFLIQFIIFKQAFLLYGFNIINQNIPKQILSQYFSNINLFSIIAQIGILPLILGVISIFLGFFYSRRDHFFLLISLSLSSLLLLILKLIPITTGLIFLGLSLSILSAFALERLFSYITVTKFSILEKHVFNIFILIILFSLFLPSIFAAKDTLNNIPDEIDVQALEWIKGSIEEDAIILTSYEEANLLSYKTGKKNIADSNFLLAPDAEERLQDINILYTTGSKFKAIELLNKYNVNFIFLSEKTKRKYNINDLSYIQDQRCFLKRKYEQPKIYQVRPC